MKKLDLNDLTTHFKLLGVKKGMTIEVHSSLSSFGHIIGGAKTLIDALMKTVTNEGTIIMPTFLLSTPYELSNNDLELGIKTKKKILLENSDEKSDMGCIPDTFRKLEGVLSGSGMHRFSAWGKKSKDYIKGNESFFQIIEDDGYGLLLGVELNKLSSMHSVEKYINSEIWDLFPKINKEITKFYNPKKWFVLTSDPYTNNWLKIQQIAIEQKLMNETKLGNATTRIFKLKPIANIYKEEILKDPLTLFNLSRN